MVPNLFILLIISYSSRISEYDSTFLKLLPLSLPPSSPSPSLSIFLPPSLSLPPFYPSLSFPLFLSLSLPPSAPSLSPPVLRAHMYVCLGFGKQVCFYLYLCTLASVQFDPLLFLYCRIASPKHVTLLPYSHLTHGALNCNFITRGSRGMELSNHGLCILLVRSPTFLLT